MRRAPGNLPLEQLALLGWPVGCEAGGQAVPVLLVQGSGSRVHVQGHASGLKMPLFQLLTDIVLYKTGPNQCPALKNNAFLVDIKSYAQDY